MVPKGWSKKELGDIAHITSGGTPSREKIEYWANGTIPWIRTTEVQNCVLNLDDTKEFITELGLKKSSAKLVPAGSILLAMIGQGKTRGQVALLNFEASTNQNCAVIILNADNDPVFYFNYLLSQYENIRGASNSAGQSNLSGALVKAIRVPVPTYFEQQKIAQILSTWDQAISITEKLLENSQQQKKALMQQLLAGEKRLLDENGTRFSEKWDIFELKDISQIIMGSSPKSEFYNDLGNGLPLIQGNADIKNRYSNPRIYTSEITKECLKGDILLSVRAPVGTVAQSRHHACVGRGIAAIRAKLETSQSFLYHLMLWQEPKWVNFSQGSTFESINSDDIKSLRLVVPSFEEQKKIAEVLTVSDQEIATLQNKLDCLKQEKNALMQQLLTGKKRVKVAA